MRNPQRPPKTVRPIWQVAVAFAQRERMPNLEAIRNRWDEIYCDHRGWLMWKNRNVEPRVLGIPLLDGAVLVTTALESFGPFVKRGLTASGVKVVWLEFFAHDNVRLLEQLFAGFEREARRSKKSRAWAIQEWMKLCYNMGMGDRIALPDGPDG